MLDEQALLEALNSTPVVGGQVRDRWADDEQPARWIRAHGGSANAVQLGILRAARDRLQAVVAGRAAPELLAEFLAGTRQVPRVGSGGVDWVLEADPDREPAVELVLAWSAVQQRMPGRLRPCANGECRLFLLDRSRANTARWCSMKVCGNRLKARRHQRRQRSGRPAGE